MIRYFGGSKALATITPGDADEYNRWLSTKVGENTTSVHCRRAKQLFRAAVRKRIIDENPFGDMKGCYVKENRTREYFVKLDVARRVLDACPGTQWKLIFALARFGGL